MSRRCRASLVERGTTNEFNEDTLDSGITCGKFHIPPEPCTEPLVYGELVTDPGFEDLFALMDRDRLDLPEWNTAIRQYRWDTANEVVRNPKPPLPWHSNFTDQWALNTTEQDTGAYCVISTTGVPGVSTQQLIPARTHSCTVPSGHPSFRVATGDFMLVSARIKTTVSGQRFSYTWDVFSEPFTSVGGGSTTFDLDGGTTYTTYTKGCFLNNVFNPTREAYWSRLRMRGQVVSGDPDWIVDNVSCILIPASVELLLCAFSSLITVDNDTTETSFLS